ncbi:hypothetical protein BH11MYX1_BH11MYX1_52660 [soil metagenome]
MTTRILFVTANLLSACWNTPPPVQLGSIPADAGRDVTARFVLDPVACEPSNASSTCYKVSLALTGRMNETRLIAPTFASQSGCTAGETVECAGPSGATSIRASCDLADACVVQVRSESDGYCPANDCASIVVADKFALPHGAHLVLAPAAPSR